MTIKQLQTASEDAAALVPELLSRGQRDLAGVLVDAMELLARELLVRACGEENREKAERLFREGQTGPQGDS